MVTNPYGYECEACYRNDDGYDDYASALRAEIAHLERCDDPDAPECLREARERLAELTRKDSADA